MCIEDCCLKIPSSHSCPSPLVSNYTNGLLTVLITGMNCNHTVTVSCLRELYNVSGYAPTATATNKIGITGYLRQFATNGDLHSFSKPQVPSPLHSTFHPFSSTVPCPPRSATIATRISPLF